MSGLGIVMHTNNASTWEPEVGESQVWDQPELHSMTLSKNDNKTDEWLLIHSQDK
jgi:hypothetical protein